MVFFIVARSLISFFSVTLPQDMIHIADTKVARRYGDFFIRQIHKFEEVSKEGIEKYRIMALLFIEASDEHVFVIDIM